MTDTYEDILHQVLGNAKTADYYGYNKHDGLLSPLLSRVFSHTKITRLIAIQMLMRCPLNLRPFFGVPKTRNPKGIGLFAHAYLMAGNLSSSKQFLEEAKQLLKWLQENHSQGFEGMSWGYQYPWQDIGFLAPPHLPNRVVTCWIGYAFHHAYIITGNDQYLDICNEICRFLLHNPNKIVDTDNELCLSYVPDEKVTWAVMDVSALCAKMLALTAKARNESSYLEPARRCIQYVMNRQTDYHAWYYTDPPKDSHITHDNYHSGIILDCILDYMDAIDDYSFMDKYIAGLKFYKDELFTRDRAPKWMNNKTYPYDIHGAAQGIISFSKAAAVVPEYLETAREILDWTIANLYDQGKGTFWYQKTPFYTKKFTLLRWCNGWMSRALVEYLNAKDRIKQP